MTYIVDSKVLRDAVARVKPAAMTRSSALPVLAGILITFKDAVTAEIEATDASLRLSTTIPVEFGVTEKREVPSGVLPVGALTSVLNTFQGEIKVGFLDDEFTLLQGGSHLALRALSANDFPRRRQPEDDPQPIELDEDGVAALVRIATCASRDDARPILTGIGFRGEGAAATDSYRLAAAYFDGDDWPEFIMPAELVRWLPKAGDWCADLYERSISWEVDGLRVSSLLIDGKFPNFEQLIPALNDPEYAHALRFDRKTLVDALGRLRKFKASRDSLTVKFDVSAKDCCTLSVYTRDVLTVSESVPLLEDSLPAPGFTYALNADFIHAIASKVITSDEFLMVLREPLRPVVIDDTQTVVALAMPVRNV